jgi:hypothetical protein
MILLKPNIILSSFAHHTWEKIKIMSLMKDIRRLQDQISVVMQMEAITATEIKTKPPIRIGNNNIIQVSPDLSIPQILINIVKWSPVQLPSQQIFKLKNQPEKIQLHNNSKTSKHSVLTESHLELKK